jgi:hypothetical protein
MSNELKLSPKHGVNPTIPICFWCGKEKEEIALLGQINKKDSEAPRRVIMDYEPCEQCKELFNMGIHIIGVSTEPMVETMFPIVNDENITLYPTGSMFVSSEEWVTNFLTANNQQSMLDNVLSNRVLMLPDTIVTEIIEDSKAEEMNVEILDDEKENTDENN